MNHPLSCACGQVKGTVEQPERAVRGVCFCRDCQAFAHYLGRADELLDAFGGTGIIAARPSSLSITSGFDRVACMSLSENGLLRWYTACCNTPLGNTPRQGSIPHIGLIPACLGVSGPAFGAAFGPVRMHVHKAGAHGPVPAMRWSTFTTAVRYLASTVSARLDGSARQHPLFAPDLKTPIVQPNVLPPDERSALETHVRDYGAARVTAGRAAS